MSKFSLYPPMLEGRDVQAKRKEIRAYFHNTFNLFEKIFELLNGDEVFYKKSELTRHPMIFYFGHTATFFVNKFINMGIIKERINPEFESVFAVGVDEMEWDDLNEARYRWPSVNEVREYRTKARELVDEVIMTLEFVLPIVQESPMWIVLMGIEHERIHIETSLVLHRQMPLGFIKEVEEFLICEEFGSAPENTMINIPTSHVSLGKEKNHNLYGWDNEYGIYTEQVKEFKVSKYLVSNSEFMEFVDSGGYENSEFWDEEGKKFLQITEAKHPSFWVKNGSEYKYRALSRIISMPLSWPVDVNALEAEAFCRYKSKKDGVVYSLLSEAEYGAMSEFAGLKDIPWFDEHSANLNLAVFSSCPVDKFSFNGIYDLVGNVWQWSRTPIFGFDGFRVHEAYDDFSTPTFDGKHALILGSSWASSGNLIMKHSRYAFRRHFFQNAGFRYVVSNSDTKKESEIFENDELVSRYCEFQYGLENLNTSNFAKEIVKIASKFITKTKKALDLGCAIGRASFELARYFDEVEGVDLSARFISVATRLKSSTDMTYRIKLENGTHEKRRVSLQEFGYDNLRDKVSFWQGDACNLKPNFNSYDLVVATNLADKSCDSLLFLKNIQNRINSEGILLLASVNSEQESLAQKEFLCLNFELLHVQNLEFYMRDNNAEIQHSMAEVVVWRKR